METACYSYTIMPDFRSDAYGWVQEYWEQHPGVGAKIADFTGWHGHHAISKKLEADLTRWNQKLKMEVYSCGLNHRLFDWRNFHDQGLALARRIKGELGPDIKVIYEKPLEDPGNAIERKTEILDDGSLKTLSTVPLEKIIPLGKHYASAIPWCEYYTEEQLERIHSISICWSKLFLEPYDRGHYARLQLKPEKDHLHESAFKGVIDGREVNIILVVWTLQLEAARLIYSKALERTNWRYPGWWEHVYEDGVVLGERILRFVSGTHNLASCYMYAGFILLCEKNLVPSAFEKVETLPRNYVGDTAEMIDTERYGVRDDYRLVRVVLSVEELNDDLIDGLESQLKQGKPISVAGAGRMPVYTDIKPFLFELNLSELALLNRADARKGLSAIDRKLIHACENLDLAAMRAAIQQGANLNAIDEYEGTPFSSLLQSLMDNDYLLDHPEDSSYYSGRKVLLLGAEEKKELVKMLLSAEAHPNLTGFLSLTPAAHAGIEGQEEILEVLLDEGADPTIHCSNGCYEDWPSCWDYASTDSSLGYPGAARVLALLEKRCPTPYWEPCEEELVQKKPGISFRKNRLIGFHGNLSRNEYSFLNRPGMKGVAVAAVNWGRAINLLDIKYIKHNLADEIIFEDAVSTFHLKGKDAITAYWDDFIRTLSMAEKKQRVFVQLGTDSSGLVVPLLCKWEEREPYSWIEIEEDSYKFVSFHRVVYHGSLLKFIVKSGVFPGFDVAPWESATVDE
ncbi:MAG: hypothetical protein HQK55_04445 [Deltaproteobacteria bacterium]|nr:hypothetical protein [Deltaproteobacteria bacterium]